jgi:hypothetical protein
MLRTKRLLLFTSQLGEKSHRAFQSLPQRQMQGQQYLLAYLDAAEKYNGGEIPENREEVTKRFDAVCTSVATLLGMPESAGLRKADLKKWGEQNDRRGFRLFRDLIDPEKDFKTLRKTQVIWSVGGDLLMVERIVNADRGSCAITRHDVYGIYSPMYTSAME